MGYVDYIEMLMMLSYGLLVINFFFSFCYRDMNISENYFLYHQILLDSFQSVQIFKTVSFYFLVK